MVERAADGLGQVRARYDQLAADVAQVARAGPADLTATATATRALLAEARALDAQDWPRWLSWCTDDVVIWVPLSGDKPHPAHDQSLFLDDRRRVEERLWRFTDPNAWAVVPFAPTVRAVAGIEAWPLDAETLLVSSVLRIDHAARRTGYALTGRQTHRLRMSSDHETGTRLEAKTMIFPALHAGTRHLGWLL